MCPNSALSSGCQSCMLSGCPPCVLHGPFCCGRLTAVSSLVRIFGPWSFFVWRLLVIGGWGPGLKLAGCGSVGPRYSVYLWLGVAGS